MRARTFSCFFLPVLAHLDRKNLIDDDLCRWVAQLERVDGGNSLVVYQNLTPSINEVSVNAAKLILQNRRECDMFLLPRLSHFVRITTVPLAASPISVSRSRTSSGVAASRCLRKEFFATTSSTSQALDQHPSSARRDYVALLRNGQARGHQPIPNFPRSEFRSLAVNEPNRIAWSNTSLDMPVPRSAMEMYG